MKHLFGIVAVTVSSFIAAQGINFEKSSFETLLAKAKKEKKLVFVDAYAVWCGPCKLMDKNIFPLEKVGSFYNQNFINAKIDMEKGEGIPLAKKYGVTAFPTYLFINGDGEEVHRTIGYVKEDEFITFGKEALDPSQRIGTLKKKYLEGNRDPELLLKLGSSLLYSDRAMATEVVNAYFKNYPKNKAIPKEGYIMMLESIRGSDDPLMKIAAANKSEIDKYWGDGFYQRFADGQKINEAFRKSFDAEKQSYNYTLLESELNQFLSKEKSLATISKLKANIAFSQKKYDDYEKLTLESMKDYKTMSSTELNSVAWNFFEKVSNKTSLAQAIEWAKESINKESNSYNTDTLAQLYNKVGDKANAKIWAKKAVEETSKEGGNVEEAQSFLDSLK